MPNWRIVPSFVLAVVPLAVALADEDERLPSQVQPCVACHGKDGHGTAPLFPDLAAQHAEYLTLQMELFRSGARPSHIMNTVARSMSDRDIEITVDYYANLERCD